MIICGSYMLEFTVTKDMRNKYQEYQTRDHRARRRGAIPKIASLVTSMLHKKGGGTREGGNTLMSNSNCQGIEN